jgi:hypothetical protein
MDLLTKEILLDGVITRFDRIGWYFVIVAQEIGIYGQSI